MQRRLSSRLLDGFFATLSTVGRRMPRARAELATLERIEDVPYKDDEDPAHRLDVWRPKQRSEPLPIVLYVHGGGFAALSKDSHWIMALVYARSGYLVFNINYRLAPQHPFPAALQDVLAAYAWVVEHGADYGGDPARISLAGESAGANLILGALLASCFDRPEPWARALAKLPPPICVMPMCGVFQVSEPERLWRTQKLGAFSRSLLLGVTESYLGAEARTEDTALADPLLVLEGPAKPRRPLPPIFLGVGTADPLKEDQERLAAALEARGSVVVSRFYDRELHAFHALVFRQSALDCWRDIIEFANEHTGQAS